MIRRYAAKGPTVARPSASGIFQGRRLLIGGGPSTVPQPTPAPIEEPPPEVAATVAARKLAGELGLNLAHLNGSGAHGEVTAADVRAAAKRRRK